MSSEPVPARTEDSSTTSEMGETSLRLAQMPVFLCGFAVISNYDDRAEIIIGR